MTVHYSGCNRTEASMKMKSYTICKACIASSVRFGAFLSLRILTDSTESEEVKIFGVCSKKCEV